MKTGFSSLVCPDWDFGAMVSRAAELGYDGIELCSNRDPRLSTQAAEAAAAPQDARRRLRDAGIELLCLGAGYSLTSTDRDRVRSHQAAVGDMVTLAADLGCPFVRVPLGRLDRMDTRPHARTRIAETLLDLVPAAVERNVTILIENGGDLATSEDVWFILDAASHPSIQCCWNQCIARGDGERPTISIPRVSHRIAMVHVCDAQFDQAGRMQDWRLPGDGNAEMDRVIPFLRGMFFDGPVVFHWPAATEPSLSAPDEALPEVLTWLRQQIAEKGQPLSAYKRDKYAPNYGSIMSSGSGEG